ncbi:MAG: caspase family protein, partial [Planctomycetota bacterium]|nr:caspase family protein [Planctomycetota bacterium]
MARIECPECAAKFRTEGTSQGPTFCPRCGAKLNLDESSSQAPPILPGKTTAIATPATPRTTTQRSRKPVILWSIGAAAAVLIVCIATFVMRDGNRIANDNPRGARSAGEDGAPPVAAMTGRKVALLIGVNQYEKRGFAEKPLSYAERDVDELAQEFTKHKFEVRLLKGSLAGADRATKANIQAAVDALLTGRKADDLVLVGLAGHGQQMPLRDADGRIRV